MAVQGFSYQKFRMLGETILVGIAVGLMEMRMPVLKMTLKKGKTDILIMVERGVCWCKV